MQTLMSDAAAEAVQNQSIHPLATPTTTTMHHGETVTGGLKSWKDYTWIMNCAPTMVLRQPDALPVKRREQLRASETKSATSNEAWTLHRDASKLRSSGSHIPLVTNPSLGPRYRPAKRKALRPQSAAPSIASSIGDSAVVAQKNYSNATCTKRGIFGQPGDRGSYGLHRPQSALGKVYDQQAAQTKVPDPRYPWSGGVQALLTLQPTPFASHTRTDFTKKSSIEGRSVEEKEVAWRHKYRNSIEHEFPHQLNPLYNGSLSNYIRSDGTIGNVPNS